MRIPLQFVTQPVKNAKNCTRFNGGMRPADELRLQFVMQPDDRHKKARQLAKLFYFNKQIKKVKSEFNLLNLQNNNNIGFFRTV